MKYRLDEETVKQTKTSLNGQALRVVISNVVSSWRSVTNGVPKGSIPDPVPL